MLLVLAQSKWKKLLSKYYDVTEKVVLLSGDCATCWTSEVLSDGAELELDTNSKSDS